jgi:CheY-like chemotaxis protein
VGVLAVALNIARLSSLIGFVGLPEGSTVVLHQQDGAVIAASDEPERWVGQSLAEQAAFRAIRDRGGSGLTDLALPGGGDYVAGYHTLERAPWVMLAAIPHAEVDAAAGRSLVRVSQQSGMDGFETSRRIKRRADIPIITLTAIDAEATKVRAIEQYADDCVTKPFSSQELSTRVGRVLKRAWPAGTTASTEHVDDHLTLDFAAQTATVASELRQLTPTVARLLHLR